MTKTKTVLAAIGCTLIVTAASAATLMGGAMQNRAMTAAHPTPTATQTLPQATTTITAPRATITKQLPAATITRTVKVPTTTLTCPAGATEDSCYPDYIGKGRWVLRVGERSMPKATKSVAPGKHSTGAPKRVRKATIVPGVCKHPSIITRVMLHDCIALAGRPKVVAPGKYEIPQGRVLVRECTDQYTGRELGTCLKQ